ncbi:hypothetical protein [Devosia sp. SD17-2]|uniref:hypothetical protein n=1 Tax=Devosia sp. SD17-2 TaxID=2976459 RepID=UPI0023D8B546|nr:hypothetical protein [Devosia sp. SD17-2]WEJ33857.1 hypothetical protein NYQ88_03320 [Devosia sp. SD17-2]
MPDVIAGISIRHCCDKHDPALFVSFDMGVFDKANVAFAHCLWDAGLWWFALPALFAVSTVELLLYWLGPKGKMGKMKR